MRIKGIFFIFIVISLSANAQSEFKIYITQSGNVTNNIREASSYATIKKNGDLAWFAKEFDMRDSILSSGYYRDKELKIPNGKFTYYHRFALNRGFKFMGKLVIDTVNCINYTGYYINGIKTGEWLHYSPNGSRLSLSTYANDMQNGLFEEYDDITGKVAVEGYYKNNKREGDWCKLDSDSLAIYTDIYKRDKLVKHINYFNPLVKALSEKNDKNAEPIYELGLFIQRKLDSFNALTYEGKFVIAFIVTNEGKVVHPHVTQSYDPEFDDIVLNAILSSRWKPALKNGKPINQLQYFTINILYSSGQLNYKTSFRGTYKEVPDNYKQW